VNHWNKHKILSKYEQNKYLIQIASCFRVFPMFWKVASPRNEISLCKWSGGTAQFRTLEAGGDQASNVRWDISVVVSFITASLL